MAPSYNLEQFEEFPMCPIPTPEKTALNMLLADG